MSYRAAGFVIFRRCADHVQYLLLQASYGDHHWSPPKGFLNDNEDDLTAAIRETEEETGYSEKDLKIFKDISHTLQYTVKGKLKTVVYWLAELIDPQKQPAMSHEHENFKWLMKEDAKTIGKYKDLAELLDCFDEKIQRLPN